MSNQTKQEKACRYFWESTLYAPMVLPTILPFEQIKLQLPIPFAEREDTLTLRLPGDSEKTVHMHTTAWMRSLDYLLYRYLTLVLHDPHYSSTIRVPVEVRLKYQKYRIAWKKRQCKNHDFILPNYYIKPHNGSLDASDRKEEYESFKTDNPVAPAILNVFCHGLFPKANDKETRWNPHIHSQRYKLKSCGDDTIPSFNPEDYIAYELMTGLSLSTEITAILLEIDQEIRDLALYYFCEYAIKDLVRIPFPYARSTAARNFFLQVNLAWSKNKHEWTPGFSPESTVQAIESAATNALPCIQMLSTSLLCPEESPARPYDIVEKEGADLKTILQMMENSSNLRLKHVVEGLRKAENDPTYGEKYRISPNPFRSGQFKIESFVFPRFPISFPITEDIAEIEAYKKQILENLRAVTSPLDCKSLFNPKPENLAVFTNPNHKYIPLLMKYIEDGKPQTRSEKNPPPIKSKDCFDLFHSVFSIIRFASIEAHQDIYRVKRFLKQMEPPLI